MKPKSAAPKFFVTIEMATVRDNPQRFDQSWIPPRQITPSKGKYGTANLKPWLREYSYIYSSPSLDFIDEVWHNPLKVSNSIYYILLSIKVLIY